MTFKAIGDERPENSICDYFESVIERYINIENEAELPNALFDVYNIVVSIMQGSSGSFFWYNQFEKNFFEDLRKLAKTLLLFTVRLITEKTLSSDERIIREKLMRCYGRVQAKNDFNSTVNFLFGLESPEEVEELSAETIQSIASMPR